MGVVATRLAAMTHRVLRHFGDRGTAELRRPHQLRDTALGAAPSALAVHGAHLAGVASITLRGTSKLRGELPAGCQVTIAGTVYTTQAAASANSSGRVTVSILPVLAGDASDGAAATISRAYGTYTFTVMRAPDAVEQDADGAVRLRGRVFHLSAVGASLAPRQGDLLLWAAETLTVNECKPVDVGGGAVRYSVLAGEVRP